MPAPRKPMTATEPVIVPIEDVPVPEVARTHVSGNPLLESVRKLADTMPRDADGEPTDRSTGAGKMSVPRGDVRRHLRWLWDAGDALVPPVSVSQHQTDDPDDPDRVIVWYWTRPKIRKGK